MKRKYLYTLKDYVKLCCANARNDIQHGELASIIG